jgi:hypothetical protein
MFWSYYSDLKFTDCKFEFISGTSLFAGEQNYATNLIQITGVTEVSPSAYAWVSQPPNYSGFKVHISGTYPTLEPWYFIHGRVRAASSRR